LPILKGYDMNTLIISYDLNKQGQNYKDLYDGIKTLASGAPWHCLDSTWIIKSLFTPEDACRFLEKTIDKNDKLLVVQTSDHLGAWTGFDTACSDWLKANL